MLLTFVILGMRIAQLFPPDALSDPTAFVPVYEKDLKARGTPVCVIKANVAVNLGKATNRSPKFHY
jgi:hypothetical protein